MDRHVFSSLAAQVLAPATVELQVAVAGEPPADESLVITLDGQPVEPRVLTAPVGGRLHVLELGPGELRVDYRATVPAGREVTAEPMDTSLYLRPSRYAESDRLAAVAQAELGGLSEARELLPAVTSWVGQRMSYVPGSTCGTDGAVDVLLARQGVCRDFAHLTVGLLRALDVPARLAAVYAPGLSPMDFHAVVEALVDGTWWVADPTLLAPRPSMVRISTGRDAADTALFASYGGEVVFGEMQVTATVDGDLPTDDLDELVRLG